MVSQEEIMKKLRECLDPELGINIIDLGLIYSIMIEDSRVNILMTLTTPGCSLQSYFIKDISEKLKLVKGVSDVSVELTFDPPWNPAKMSAESQEILHKFHS